MWWIADALAGGDYAAEAKKMMRLSYDLDDVEQMLEAPAAPRAAQSVEKPVPVAPLPLEPNSALDAVVVFADRAVVTRHIEASLTPGVTQVAFRGLPLGLDPQSLQASSRAGDARIVGVELLSGAGKVEAGEQTERIRAEAKEVAEQLGQVGDRIAALLSQRSYLRDSLTGGKDRPAPSIDVVRGTLAYVGDAERDLAQRLRKEQESANELDEKLRPLLVRLQNPNATGLVVRVDVEQPKGGKADIELQYQVFGARWWPSYNARLDAGAKRVTLDYVGTVAQQTGEDWTNADLRLSTANPATQGGLPQLGSWYLGRGSGFNSAQVGYVTEGRSRAGAGDAGPVESRMSAGITGGGMVVFAIPGKRTVKGDGSEQRLPIGSQTFASELELATAPRATPEAFRQARLVYQGEAPLLPGAVATFVGNDFVGGEAIDTVVPGDNLRLSFGVDDQVKVERRLIAKNEEQLGGKRLRYSFEFRIVVRNFGKEARSVTVSDQVPVSESDRVVVTVGESTPPLPPAPDDPAGVMRWKLDLPANGERAVTLKWSVVLPREDAAARGIQEQLDSMY
jgi:uncharacterized protein (TIGR02231 family)